MTRMQRIRSVSEGIIMLLSGLVMMAFPKNGCVLVLLLLAVSLTAKGLGMLVYFLTMARHMVGGRMILYQGIIVLELGVFAMTQMDMKPAVIMMYLTVGLLFSGIIDALRALEEKKIGASGWKIKLLIGAGFILFPLIALLEKSTQLMADTYFLSMVYGGILRIAAAFRKSAVPLIPD